MEKMRGLCILFFVLLSCGTFQGKVIQEYPMIEKFFLECAKEAFENKKNTPMNGVFYRRHGGGLSGYTSEYFLDGLVQGVRVDIDLVKGLQSYIINYDLYNLALMMEGRNRVVFLTTQHATFVNHCPRAYSDYKQNIPLKEIK